MTKSELTKSFTDNAIHNHLLDLIDSYQKAHDVLFVFEFSADGFASKEDVETIKSAKEVLSKIMDSMNKVKSNIL